LRCLKSTLYGSNIIPDRFYTHVIITLDVRRIPHHYRFSAYRDMEGRPSVRRRKQWDIGAYIMGVVIIGSIVWRKSLLSELGEITTALWHHLIQVYNRTDTTNRRVYS
jgi:hypothetical protein